MATNNKLPKQPLLVPEVTPDEATEVITDVVPEETPEVTPEEGPEIVYVGEGAENVVFTVNPKAVKYVVHANGLVLENL